MALNPYEFAYYGSDPLKLVTSEDLDFHALAKAGGVTSLTWKVATQQQEIGSQEGHGMILNAVNGFLAGLMVEAEAPTAPEAREYYAEVHKGAETLLQLVCSDDSKLRRLRARLVPLMVDMPEFRCLLGEISERAAENRDHPSVLPIAAGRPTSAARYGLLIQLHGVWKTAGGTGKGAYWDEGKGDYTGSFYDLAKTLICQLQHMAKLQDFPGLSDVSNGLGVTCRKAARYKPPANTNPEPRPRE